MFYFFTFMVDVWLSGFHFFLHSTITLRSYCGLLTLMMVMTEKWWHDDKNVDAILFLLDWDFLCLCFSFQICSEWEPHNIELECWWYIRGFPFLHQLPVLSLNLTHVFFCIVRSYVFSRHDCMKNLEVLNWWRCIKYKVYAEIGRVKGRPCAWSYD